MELWTIDGWDSLQPAVRKCIRAIGASTTKDGDDRRAAHRHPDGVAAAQSAAGASQASRCDPVIQQAIDTVRSGIVVQRLRGADKGPRASIAILTAELQDDAQSKAWSERARLEALCGSSQLSLREVGSALRAWEAFATPVLGLTGAALLPPSVDGLLSWSRHFGNKRTFSNYVGKLILACEILRMPTQTLKHASVVRASRTIKALAKAPMAKRYTRRAVVADLITLAKSEGDAAAAWLYCLTYAFLLRVPSEALSATLGCNGETHGDVLPEGHHSCLSRVGDRVRLQLRRRKHRPHGSTLTRRCWCHVCKVTCPVHCQEELLLSAVAGARPFVHMSPSYVVSELRRRLAILKTPFAQDYDTRCFRRGHAEEIARSTGNLRELLAAGEWSSKRFTEYLNLEELEDLVASRADGNGSSDED